MNFFRENILKIVIVIAILVIVIIVSVSLFSGKTISNTSYANMEENMKRAAVKYTNQNQGLLPKSEGEIKTIKLDTLVNNKKIKELKALEDENITCTGYVSISMKDKDYIYKPYLKCGKYYETKTIADYIKANEPVVTSDDGLYAYGEKLVYRGENPNNYVTLGDKIYRIIEVTEDGNLKLISTVQSQYTVVWDDRYNNEKNRNYGINNYSKSRIKDSLKELYDAEEYFSADDKKKIIKHDVCIGKKALDDVSIDGASECSVKEQNQYVSLIQVNEYMRASVDQNCVASDRRECSNYNYLLQVSSDFRTVTAVSDNTYQVYDISYGVAEATNASNRFRIYPVIYLDKDVLYKSGNGTSESPYTLR